MADGQESGPVEASSDSASTPVRRVQFSPDTKLGPDEDETPSDSGRSSRGQARGRANRRSPSLCVWQQDFESLVITNELDNGDQKMVSQNHEQLPSVCSQLWHADAKLVDLRCLKLDMRRAKEQLVSLNAMKKELKTLYFDVEFLQHSLQALERVGIATLDSVEECYLILQPKDLGTGDEGEFPHNCVCAVYDEWPLHSLPKLMENLRRLRKYSAAFSAMTDVFQRCRLLKHLYIKADSDTPLDLSGVVKCPIIEGISVPVSMFAIQRELLVGCPHQHLIELSHCGRKSGLTVDCLNTIFGLKSEAIEAIQMDCSWLESGAQSLAAMAMGRCTHVRSLVLGNCDFWDVAIEGLDLPQVQRYIGLDRCHNLTNEQVLDMVRQCPQLREFYVVQGALLTGELLHGIYRMRIENDPGYPLTFILRHCTKLVESYNTMFSEYWAGKQDIVRVKHAEDDIKPIADVQLFFHGYVQVVTSLEENMEMSQYDTSDA
ncbi:Hypothetical predicted protein [Drosophila guanche]|uniref:Uncharacterized protein n=3 Tax=Drosophila guanche TaxID=7266 RepID=A0A3B0JWP1_DROGU|nr:Hypothetical predicted protein [Drosophila guanche]